MTAPVPQVKIKLITRDEDVRVADAPLFVPVSLKRYGLSEVVNHLLELESPVPFDFLIDGQLLRSNLESYLIEKGLSSETTITVEYTRSILPPSFRAAFSHPDWVSAVDISPFSSSSWTSHPTATGSYDGIVRLWNLSGNVSHQLAGHKGAVKTVKWTTNEGLVSGGADRTLCLWKVKPTRPDVEPLSIDDEDDLPSGKSSIRALLQGHTGSIDDIAVHNSSGRIISASEDTTLKIWSNSYKDMPQYTPPSSSKSSTASQKRRKLASNALPDARSRGALGTLTGHTSPVTGVVFHATDDSTIYSVSMDHSIRTWDLQSQSEIDNRVTSFPLLSIASLSQLNLLACGSSARHITLHDPRASTTTTQAQLIGHKNFVVSLTTSPSSQYMFASGSHDGTSRIWDVRAQKCLYVINRDSKESPTAVYAVDWKEPLGLASAGQDKKLQINYAQYQD